MMYKLNLLIFFILFGLSGCELVLEKQNKIDGKLQLTDTSEVLIQAQKNILYKNKNSQGVDTLELKLLGQDYDPSLFYSYHTLIVGYLFLDQIEKADSVWGLIKENNLSSDEEILYFSDAYMINLLMKQYKAALFYLPKIHQHKASKTELSVQKAYYNYEKWFIYSELKQCDSARYYLDSYITSLKKSDRARGIQDVDSFKLDYIENQLERECPLVDSIGKSIMRIVPYSW